MKIERTLSIIKPDAVSQNIIGKIITRFEQSGLKIIAAIFKKLSRIEIEQLYLSHKDKTFFKNLVNFMLSGPVFIKVLEGENAIQKTRLLIGATDPKKAAPGTIRSEFGKSIKENSIHGSDTPEKAELEIGCFFPELGKTR